MPPYRHTTAQHLVLAWGRFRRLWLNLFRPAYVRGSTARRHGTCRRCGACCQLGSRCRHLSHEGGLAVCAAYGESRPPNCGTFPIDERDLADRDRIGVGVPCGYYWLPAEEPVRAGIGRGELGTMASPSPGRGGGVLTVSTVGAQAMALAPAEARSVVQGAGSNQSCAESPR